MIPQTLSLHIFKNKWSDEISNMLFFRSCCFPRFDGLADDPYCILFFMCINHYTLVLSISLQIYSKIIEDIYRIWTRFGPNLKFVFTHDTQPIHQVQPWRISKTDVSRPTTNSLTFMNISNDFCSFNVLSQQHSLLTHTELLRGRGPPHGQNIPVCTNIRFNNISS